MRSSVSYMLSESSREPAMSYPDYKQEAYDHSRLLILIRGIGSKKPKTLQKVFEEITKVTSVNIVDSSNRTREIHVRFVWDYPVENNDWGDFQAHRKLLGLITVGKFDNQTELNELCRIHESLKVKYASTLFDSRCLLFNDANFESENGSSPSTPSNFKSHVLFYAEDNDKNHDIEVQIKEYVNALFWILESKRLEKTKEKIDRVSLLTAPFEAKDFVGLDMESRNNKKRCIGRNLKFAGDLALQSGLVVESLNLFYAASETLRAVGDSLWLGAAYEGLCSASAIILYPHMRASDTHSRRLFKSITSDTENSFSLTLANSSTNEPQSDTSSYTEPSVNEPDIPPNLNVLPANTLSPDEIVSRYRDAIINYSKYRHAGIIETEAALKAARICIEQNQKLDVSMFLQNVLYINLNMTETEKIRRFEVLTQLYMKIGYYRKAAFCQRLAAWRYIAQSNTSPDWAQSYCLMLECFLGYKLSLEPTEVLTKNIGWPALQIDLLQQLISAARRLGQSALATRHMTFLLQTMWKHLSQSEQAEMAIQLQNLSSQSEGSPVNLHLSNGKIIPAANLTDVPFCTKLKLRKLSDKLAPKKLAAIKMDIGPFLFTPIHFGTINKRHKDDNRKVIFEWVKNEVCEVELHCYNPLPFELSVADMRILTRGVVFESHPQTIILQPSVPKTVLLKGIPLEAGELIVYGYSTHTLGVKSNSQLCDMFDRDFPKEFTINVTPALPLLAFNLSIPDTITVVSNTGEAVSLSIFKGQTADVTVTITNNSDVLLEYLECDLQSTFANLQNIFKFDKQSIKDKLPLAPNKSIDFVLKIFGDADFIGNNVDPVSCETESNIKGDTNLSFRGESSGHSSLNTVNFSLTGSQRSYHIDAQMVFRYAGNEGYQSGNCREGSITFNLDLIPSVQITNWDVLPAETFTYFYLVLDISNSTNYEMSLNYIDDKMIIIQAKESCRVPIPLERYTTDRFAKCYNINHENQSNEGAIDALERVCANYISSSVCLKWSLPTKIEGIATLKGISLPSSMLNLVMMTPLEWDVLIDNVSVTSHSEIKLVAGNYVNLTVEIRNISSMAIDPSSLGIEFYQDYQNGNFNNRLETRVVVSGPQPFNIPKLERNTKVSHSCSVVFFTTGRFKMDFKCQMNSNETLKLNKMDKFDFLQSMNQTNPWRLIPPIEISVID